MTQHYFGLPWRRGILVMGVLASQLKCVLWLLEKKLSNRPHLSHFANLNFIVLLQPRIKICKLSWFCFKDPFVTFQRRSCAKYVLSHSACNNVYSNPHPTNVNNIINYGLNKINLWFTGVFLECCSHCSSSFLVLWITCSFSCHHLLIPNLPGKIFTRTTPAFACSISVSLRSVSCTSSNFCFGGFVFHEPHLCK